jgi:mannose/fructose/N-acetylgalactosamine-specific phosphotransferase system component IID
MGHRLTGNFDQDQVDGFEQMQEDGKADSYSEAVRIASSVGLQQLGYTNGQKTETTLNKYTQRFGYAFGLIGIVWLATTLTYPVSLRLPAIAALSSSVGCFAMHKALESREPAVTNYLKGLVGGETA